MMGPDERSDPSMDSIRLGKIFEVCWDPMHLSETQVHKASGGAGVNQCI